MQLAHGRKGEISTSSTIAVGWGVQQVLSLWKSFVVIFPGGLGRCCSCQLLLSYAGEPLRSNHPFFNEKKKEISDTPVQLQGRYLNTPCLCSIVLLSGVNKRAEPSAWFPMRRLPTTVNVERRQHQPILGESPIPQPKRHHSRTFPWFKSSPHKAPTPHNKLGEPPWTTISFLTSSQSIGTSRRGNFFNLEKNDHRPRSIVHLPRMPHLDARSASLRDGLGLGSRPTAAVVRQPRQDRGGRPPRWTAERKGVDTGGDED